MMRIFLIVLLSISYSHYIAAESSFEMIDRNEVVKKHKMISPSQIHQLEHELGELLIKLDSIRNMRFLYQLNKQKCMMYNDSVKFRKDVIKNTNDHLKSDYNNSYCMFAYYYLADEKNKKTSRTNFVCTNPAVKDCSFEDYTLSYERAQILVEEERPYLEEIKTYEDIIKILEEEYEAVNKNDPSLRKTKKAKVYSRLLKLVK